MMTGQRLSVDGMSVLCVAVWMSVFVTTAAQQRCTSDLKQPIDASVVSYCAPNIKNYSHLLIDSDNNQIVVAARSELALLPYNLSASLATRKNVSSSLAQIKTCRLTLKEATCYNFFKLLLKDTKSNNILACGTNAKKPQCHFYDSSTLADATPSVWSSIGDFDGYVPERSDTSSTAVYISDTGSVIAGSSRRPSTYAISRFTPGGTLKEIRTTFDTQRWLNSPEFVSSYSIGSYVYIFLRETALETDSNYQYSRVARVCKDDPGGMFFLPSGWVSFVKSRISCEVPLSTPSFHYNQIISTAFVANAKYRPDAASQKLFYAVFRGSTGSPSSTAVCAYGLDGVYSNDLSSVYDGPYYFYDNGFKTGSPNRFTCSTIRTEGDANKYQLTVNQVQQVTRFPLYRINGASATAIAVDQVTSDSQTYDVIFLGFDDGKVRKIGHVKSSTGSWESKVIETIQVAVGEPIVKLEVLGNNDITKRLLFVVSDSKVSQLPLHRCDRYTTCRDCVEAQDPYCGWSSSQAGCVASDTSGAVQNVSNGVYKSICPKPPTTCTMSVKTRTSDSITLSWVMDSTPSQPYDNPRFWLYQGGQSLINVSSSTLEHKISQLQPYTSYDFSIIPVNNYGVGTECELKNVITQAQAPSKVVPTVNVRSSTETEIRWSEPQQTNGPLSKYEIYVSENGGSSSLLKTVTDISKFNYKEPHTNLKPYTKYSYFVKSCTDDGTSRCSDSDSIMAQTFNDFPSKPRLVVATAVSSTEMNVKWMPPSVPNGMLTGYRVIKQPHGDQIPSCCIGTQTSIAVQGLLPYTDYTFTVEAVTSRGYGPSSDAVTEKTSAGLPDAPAAPELIASFYPDTPYILVKWSKPRNLNGQLVGYGLCRSNGTCHMFDASTLSFNDSNVQPCVTYTYSISVLTNGGNATSPSSHTLISTIPGYVTSLTSHVLSASEIQLSWKTPNNMRECIVEYYDVIQDGTRVCCHGNQLTYFASTLTPFSAYTFQVAAGTIAGQGSFRSTSATTLQARPDAPVSLMVTYSNGIAILTWKPPGVNRGTLTSYNIYKNSVLVGTVIATVTLYNVPRDFVEPGKSAKYTITAWNDVGESPPSSSRVVMRDEEAPDQCAAIYAIQSGDNSVFVSWLPPVVSNGVVTSYTLEYVKGGSGNEYVGLNREQNVTGLKVDTTYAFRVFATTGGGNGGVIVSNDVVVKKRGGATISVCPTDGPTTLSPMQPTKSQTNRPPTVAPTAADISAATVSSQEISLTWRMPSSMSESDVTRIVIKQSSAISGGQSEICCQDVKRTYRAVGLVPHTKYTFSLFVVLKSDGERDLQVSASSVTNQAAPSAPLNVRSAVIDINSITVEWDEPTSPNGVITSYDVYRDGNLEDTVNGSTRHFTVSNLEPYMNYQFRVRASTVAGSGPFSSRHVFRTREAAPGKMNRPRLAAVSTSIMYITWDPPSQPNGQLTGYKLYRKLATGDDTNLCGVNTATTAVTETIIDDGTRLNARVTKLLVGTAYCFAIQAKTAVAYGDVSDYVAGRTFDIAFVGVTNFSCPSVNFFNDYTLWKNGLSRDLPTTEASVNPTIIIGDLKTGSDDSPTVVVIVGVIAGLAIITTFVLGVMLFCMCRKGQFDVDMEVGKDFGRPVSATAVKMDLHGNSDGKAFMMQSTGSGTSRVQNAVPPDVLSGTSTGGERVSNAWMDTNCNGAQTAGRLGVASGIYEPIEKQKHEPQPPSTAPPDDLDETGETLNLTADTEVIDYEDCETTDVNA